MQRVAGREPGAHAELEARIAGIVSSCLKRALAGKGLESHEADLRQAFSLFLLERDARVLRTYRGDAALTTWIHAVAGRFFRAQVKRLAAEQARRSDGDDPEGAAGPDPENPEGQSLRRDQIEGVREVLGSLSDSERLLLALMYEQDAPARVVAQSLGVTPAGVRMKKKRLLEKLARRLEGLWP